MNGPAAREPDLRSRLILGLMLAIAGSSLVSEEAFSADGKMIIQPVSHARRVSYGSVPQNDAQVICEQDNWRTKQWDESRWGGRTHARFQAYSLEKEAWHLYLRGVGPAIHERPASKPFW
jgi:hypothetical protein